MNWPVIRRHAVNTWLTRSVWNSCCLLFITMSGLRTKLLLNNEIESARAWNNNRGFYQRKQFLPSIYSLIFVITCLYNFILTVYNVNYILSLQQPTWMAALYSLIVLWQHKAEGGCVASLHYKSYPCLVRVHKNSLCNLTGLGVWRNLLHHFYVTVQLPLSERK